MLLLSAQSVSKSFSSRQVFSDLSLTVNAGERVGVIGPNGSGKSTMLQILAGLQDPDTGEVALRKGVRLAYVPQDPQFESGKRVYDVLDEACPPGEEHERMMAVHQALGRAQFLDGEAETQTLSGGWRKRLAVARAIIQAPDLLMLDEPTNHLDLEGINWLERLLQNSTFASITVSHDRYFLDNIATSVIEINRVYPDGLLRASGNYGDFLVKKDEFLHAQAKQQEALENKVRREVEWLRRGPKARTTKSKARIDDANRLIGELSEMQSRAPKGAAQIDFAASDRKTKRLLTAENLSKSMGGRKLFDQVNVVLTPGLKLGLVGPNGSGKSTLLHLLRGTLTPDAGEVRTADYLRVVYFDQNRGSLNPDITLKQALCPDGDSVIFQGQPLHVVSWAQRFLFRKEQLDMPVGRLSGGEQARVLIAQLMLQTADVLLLDEPTNDLDIPTLEVLEDNLTEFAGALVLVTHDRYLLDRVSSLVLGLDGKGKAGLFADYYQWEQSLNEKPAAPTAVTPAKATAPPTNGTSTAPAAGKRKLSYIEAREYEQMERRILEAEDVLVAKQAEVTAAAASGDGGRIQNAYAALEQSQTRVDELYARWAELEAKLA